MRVEGATAAARDRVLRHDAPRHVDLPSGARQGRGGDGRHGSRELLGHRAPGHGGVACPKLATERDGQGQREDYLDLLLVRAIRIVVGRAESAGECVGALIRGCARAGSDGQGAGARFPCGEKVVGLGDDRVRLRGIAADADRQCGVERRRIRELLELVLLPDDRAREQDQGRRSDQCQERDGDDHHHLPGLA